MSSPLVSAIIITHNRLGLLKRAIDSVRNQTYPNIELLVVDDASSDGTKEYCEAKQIPFIHIPKHESRGGNHARNIGIQNTSGKYIALLDDDDYWLPKKTELQVEELERTNGDLVHCQRFIERIQPNGYAVMEEPRLDPRNVTGNLSKRILYWIVVMTSATMFSRSIIEKVGMFDENTKFWQEYELTIRIAQKSEFQFIDKALYIYRVNPADSNRLTNKYYEWKDSVKYIYRKHRELYRLLSFKDKAKVRQLYHMDALSRSRLANLKARIWYHTYMRFILQLPFRISNRIKRWRNITTG